MRLNFTEYVGQKFNRLLVIGVERRQLPNRTRVFFLCRCDCGQEVSAVYNDVIRGAHRSCGCLQLERITKHGHSPFDYRKKTRTYTSWLSMHQRCENPKATGYRRYGGRGIEVCARWADFSNFLADMGERPPLHSIDRLNNNKNYEPSNCRWATTKQQAENRSWNPNSYLKRKRNEKGQFC